MVSKFSIFMDIEQCLSIILGILLVVGVAGNILNCLVFLQKRLRSNPCSIFFVAASITNIIVMIYFITSTIYSTYHTPLENTNQLYCKLRLYVHNALLVISRSYLTLACVACYTQSSRNIRIRNLCRQKIVIRIIFVVPVIWFIISLHIPMVTSIEQKTCLMWMGATALYHSIYICFIAAGLPMSLMIIFSLLTYRNLRQLLRNVHPVNHPIAGHEERLGQHFDRIRLHRSDYQLSKMLFVQIIVYLIFTISYSIQTTYYAITLITGRSNSEERADIESFILFLTSAFLLNLYSATSFFVFLTSSAFRKGLRKIFMTFFFHYCRLNNQRQAMPVIAFN